MPLAATFADEVGILGCDGRPLQENTYFWAHNQKTQFNDKMAGEWREEQGRLQSDIDRHEGAEQSYMDEGVRILELARNAQALFERQPAREKRRLLNFVLSNCSWENGEVVATFRQPFDLLAETTAIAARSSAGRGGDSSKNENWLGNLDSNQD